MSWLHNMSGMSRTTVTLQHVPLPDNTARCICFNLRHAICNGLPWPDAAVLPKPVETFCRGRKPLAPWLLLALIDLADAETLDPGAYDERIKHAPRKVSLEATLTALSAARIRRELHGAWLVRQVTPAPNAVLKNDFVLTLLLLAQSTDRVFVASKQPVLDRLRPTPTLEVITTTISLPKEYHACLQH